VAGNWPPRAYLGDFHEELVGEGLETSAIRREKEPGSVPCNYAGRQPCETHSTNMRRVREDKT